RISECVIWVLLDGALKIIDRFLKTVFGSLIPEVKTHQIRVIGGDVCGVMFFQLLLLVGSKIKCKRSGDAVGNRVLNTEDVGKCLVEFFRPNRTATGDMHKLHSGPDLVPGSLDSSTQDRIHLQSAPRRERIIYGSLVFRYCAGRQN